MRSLINILDLTTEEIDKMLDVADDIIANPKKYSEVCHGKKLATLFFEPSTRTRLSFEAAMMELGLPFLCFRIKIESRKSGQKSNATLIYRVYRIILALPCFVKPLPGFYPYLICELSGFSLLFLFSPG